LRLWTKLDKRTGNQKALPLGLAVEEVEAVVGEAVSVERNQVDLDCEKFLMPTGGLIKTLLDEAPFLRRN
jgi:hypothetical protein